jgi:hypothetical protein
MRQYEQMYAQPVENSRRSPAAAATTAQPSQRTLRWARMRELGEAITAGSNDPSRIVEQARELVDVLHGLEEWDDGPAALRPVPTVALSDHQVTLIYSLVLLALVQKTESAADRPGEPRYSDARDRWLKATAGELEEVRARLEEVWGSRFGEAFG